MPTAQLTKATLETIGKPKPSKYSDVDYRPCLFKLPDGSQFWKSYPIDAHELVWLKRGQTYQVAVSGDEYTIIEPEGTPDESPAPTPTHEQQGTSTESATPSPGIPDAKKKAIAAYAVDLTRLYKFCYQQAQAELDEVPPETIQACASSCFIALQRKFNLS